MRGIALPHAPRARWRSPRVLAAVLSTTVFLLSQPWSPSASGQEVAKGQVGTRSTPEEVVAITKTRLELAKRSLRILERTLQEGAPVPVQVNAVREWSLRQLESELFLSLIGEELVTTDPELYLATSKAKPNSERTAAFAAHAVRMKEWEARFRPLYEKGFLSVFDYHIIQDYRQQAEFWLARERSRAK